MGQFRELARAIELGDKFGANIILDVMVRDSARGRSEMEHQIALGRVDAANIRRRDARPEVVKIAA